MTNTVSASVKRETAVKMSLRKRAGNNTDSWWALSMKSVKSILSFVFILICTLSSVEASPAASSVVKPVVIIDAGHTKKAPGTISITGRYEVDYNDALVEKIAGALAGAGFNPVLTRKPDQETQLDERALVAGAHNAIAMLSIHHDSAQPILLEATEKNGKSVYRTREPIAGYSIFVSKKNPQFDASFILAGLLGQELKKIGRKPSSHHSEPITGEGHAWLDADLGIYRYDDLVVLKKSAIPAILLEVGVIVDQSDEAYVTGKEHQEALVEAIVESFKKFTRRVNE
jgi:N-acetylmuramoyl-L-alanine amidase